MDELRELIIRRNEIEIFKFEVMDCIAYPDMESEIDLDYETTRIEGHENLAPIMIDYPSFDIVCMHEYEEEYLGKFWCTECGYMTWSFVNSTSYSNLKSGHTFKPSKSKRIKK